MIRIVNLRFYKPNESEVMIRVDRASVVGNPFYAKSEADRDAVCDKYEEYFKSQMQSNSKFQNYVNRIIEIARKENVALACWCAPKRCHSETIKRYVESKL
jgi:hypothetical protein